MIACVFFFFKQKTAYEMRISDWSSDVCSSDLSNTNLQQEERKISQTVAASKNVPSRKKNIVTYRIEGDEVLTNLTTPFLIQGYVRIIMEPVTNTIDRKSVV